MRTSRDREKEDKEIEAPGWFGITPKNACVGDTCIIRPPQPMQSGGFTSALTGANFQQEHESLTLNEIFPAEYLQGMLEAAKINFLFSFLSATPNDFFNRHFIKSKLTANQIFYARQVIHSLTMLSLTSYLGLIDMRSLLISVGAPAASVGLKYSGCSDTVAQIAPAGMMMAAQVASDVQSCTITMLTLLSGLGGGWLGQKTASTGYRLMSNLFHYVTEKPREIISSYLHPKGP